MRNRFLSIDGAVHHVSKNFHRAAGSQLNFNLDLETYISTMPPK